MANGIRIRLDGADKLSGTLRARAKVFGEKQTKAVQATAMRVAQEIENEGRSNIAKGGKFTSARWQDGFRAKVSFISRAELNIRVTHEVKYWRVFEFGAKILGKPMLWIPLSFGSGVGKSARDYGKPMFRVDRAGKAPLLLDDDGPQYFGKESVTIPKKWDLRSIIKNVAAKMSQYYKEEMKNG